MICPNCQYAAQESESDMMDGVCPSCGIAYTKWIANSLHNNELSSQATDAEPKESLLRRAYYYICFMPSDRDESAFWAHCILFVWFFIWGWSFILHGSDWDYIGDSFLHYVNLPFHEYGHIFFRPFGTVWMFMGGSFFQILVPLAPLAYFMFWRRENFAASLMLWWCGQNFIDVSPYIADAPTRYLPLISGIDESHDWWNVLNMTDSMQNAQFYAGLCFMIGAVVIVASQIWGAKLLHVELTGRIANPEL
tara:strand:- start:120199 stop:120948 length:750 start_codon:yes stop_codon:yes gene_type:complete